MHQEIGRVQSAYTLHTHISSIHLSVLVTHRKGAKTLQFTILTIFKTYSDKSIHPHAVSNDLVTTYRRIFGFPTRKLNLSYVLLSTQLLHTEAA